MTSTTTTRPAAGPRRSRPRRRGRLLLTVLAVVVALAGAAGWAYWRGSIGTLPLRPHCTATALGNSTELSPEQAGNAAIIAAVAVQRGLPPRAATIGIATAMQESKLTNLEGGDRDSLGLFQQRPSQGWGSPEQVRDPVYASNAFYDVLVKIEGYQDLPITKAAQTVQRSAFPAAYAEHEPEARILASALTGQSPGGLSCVLDRVGDTAPRPTRADGLTARSAAVAAAAEREAGRTGKAVAGSPGSVRFSLGAGQGAQAWSLAQWAVARADALGIERVETGGKVWDRSRPDATWTPAAGGAGTGTVVVRTAGGARS